MLGGKLKLPVKITRRTGEGGPVRLALLTSQKPPQARGRPDVQKTLREEKPNLEVPANPKAKAAADALVAATKAQSTVEAKVKMVTDAAAKANGAETAKVAAAQAQLEATQKTLAAASAQLKAATEAQTAAQKTLVDLNAKVKAAGPKDQKLAAEFAAQIKAAEAVHSAAVTKAASATAQHKAEASKLAAAEKALTAAKAASQRIADAGAKSDAAAQKELTAAKTKTAAADKAAADAEAAAKYAAEINLLIPATLTGEAYDLTLRAELLSANKQKVLATAYTPVRRIATLNPLRLSLPGEPVYNATLDPKTGASVKIEGKLERLAGQKGDVTATLEGLPAGVAVPKAVVKNGADEFTLELKFPPNFKPGAVETIKLVATGKMDPKAAQTIRSKPIDLTIVVAAQESPQP